MTGVQTCALPICFPVTISSLVFILSGGALSAYMSDIFRINVIEVRPNALTTVDLIGNALVRNPVLGVGPNMFSELWD